MYCEKLEYINGTNPDRFTADIQNQINNVSPCITSKVAYQKLLKQLVKPKQRKSHWKEFSDWRMSTGAGYICSHGQPRLSHRYDLFSIKY